MGEEHLRGRSERSARGRGVLAGRRVLAGAEELSHGGRDQQ